QNSSGHGFSSTALRRGPRRGIDPFVVVVRPRQERADASVAAEGLELLASRGVVAAVVKRQCVAAAFVCGIGVLLEVSVVDRFDVAAGLGLLLVKLRRLFIPLPE